MNSRQLIERTLSVLDQLRVIAKRSRPGRIVFADKVNTARVDPREANVIITVWKTKSLNDKARIEKMVSKDRTSFYRILKWCQEQVRFR